MVLISKDHFQRIEETIIVEFGSVGHEVSVLVLGFRDGTIDPLSQSGKAKIPVESTVSQSESSSGFSSDQKQSIEQFMENLKGILREKKKSVSINLISAPKIVGENEKKYGIEAEAQGLDMKQSPFVDTSMGHDEETNLEPDSAEVATVSSRDSDIPMPRACVDVRDMGLLQNLLATDSIPVMEKSSWVEEVDKRMNAHYSKGDPD
ncbi:hypothetical protein V6N12_011405 [Hibiscus sabdariffa]|uniref:Uncharacterized protein n=1 Tax=Hibiscus sabdariffa TaxID=183260 RepID=A0ABR2A267_9ROSI